MKSRLSLFTFVLTLAAAMFLIAGCAKKPVAAKVEPPPPPQPQPTVTLSVSPQEIQKGESAKLTWESKDATDVTIESLGSLDLNGSIGVNPTESTTYRIVAKGPGGTSDASARLTVSVPPPPVTAVVQPSLRELFERNMKDAFFAYDSYEIDNETSQLLASNANFLQEHADVAFQVVGHCDERGSEEYNLALGASRAEAVKQTLVKQGVSGDRISTNSVGKEQPFCTDSNEECWHLNRRGHFVLP
jgi:peptidoglycan-associated lipoprotein